MLGKKGVTRQLPSDVFPRKRHGAVRESYPAGRRPTDRHRGLDPGEPFVATVAIVICLVAGALLLGRDTEDGVFATILILVIGLVWANTLYTHRNHERDDRAVSGKARKDNSVD